MKTFLTCPWCGGPLKSGRLFTAGEIHWSPDKKDTRSLWERVRHPGGDLQTPMDSAPEGWFDPMGDITAYHCVGCRMFFFEGREEPIR